MRVFATARSLFLTGFLITFALGPLAAQQPTEAERDAIRSACRSDFLAHCGGVQPGGKEAFECLVQNELKLSASCKSAVNAVAPKSAAPATGEPAKATSDTPAGGIPPKADAKQANENQIKAIRQACTLDDFMAHCSWIQPSSPEVVLCLKANAAGLSSACRTAVESLPTTVAPAAVETSPTVPRRPDEPATHPKKPTDAARESAPSSPPAVTANPRRTPTAQQTSAIRAACRSDFVSRCSGVQPGGAKALECLERHAGQLSPPCKSAVAAITGEPAASPSATPSDNAPAPAAAPLAPMRALRPREALVIMRVCGEDTRSLCAGIPSGGGRIISCLAENASSLSPMCREALAAARR
jgi:hypothetical protein